jgi:hypothetical protein
MFSGRPFFVPLEEERKQFFFEKKNQKTFITCGRTKLASGDRRLGETIKSFLVLFFKKELLPSCLTTTPTPPIPAS